MVVYFLNGTITYFYFLLFLLISKLNLNYLLPFVTNNIILHASVTLYIYFGFNKDISFKILLNAYFTNDLFSFEHQLSTTLFTQLLTFVFFRSTFSSSLFIYFQILLSSLLLMLNSLIRLYLLSDLI